MHRHEFQFIFERVLLIKLFEINWILSSLNDATRICKSVYYIAKSHKTRTFS